MPEKYQMPEIGQTETKLRLRRGLCSVRRRTFDLTDLLTDHDLHEEFDPLMSPLVWDMGHIANFEGARLPSEAEWERAASLDPATGTSRTYPWGETPPTREHANLGQRGWGPAPVGAYPLGASALGVEQLLGDVYEWTSSRFLPYPGFTTFPYPEYSEVFFSDENFRVLRGASWATSPAVARNSFRNWEYRERRQILAGVRLAWTVT